MKPFTKSMWIYSALIITLSLLSALNAFLPQGDFVAALSNQELPAPKWVIALVSGSAVLLIYGALGLLGLHLARKLGFAELCDEKVSNRERFLFPAAAGVVLGVFFIVFDRIASQYHSFGALPHPPFPTSLVASITAAIGEEIVFRLFFIPLWVWIISWIILRKRWQEPVFWLATVFSALAFAAGHLPGIMLILGLEQISDLPAALMLEILLLNGALSICAGYYLKKFGFLAAVGVHFWTDIVWHVVWGLN